MREPAFGVSKIGEILSLAAGEVLETMFFTGLIGPAAPAEAPGTTALVDFRGTPSGVCGVWMGEKAAREMTASFLGVEEAGLEPSEVRQVMCEFANMICGSVVSRLESAAQIDIESPRLVADEAFRRQAAEDAIECWFEMENGALGLVLRLEECS